MPRDTDVTTAYDAEVIECLELMLGVLQLAHHDAIERAGEYVRSDPVNAAILEACAEEWTPAGELYDRVQKQTGSAPRTITRRIGDLVTRRALRQRGATKSRAYRATGLV